MDGGLALNVTIPIILKIIQFLSYLSFVYLVRMLLMDALGAWINIIVNNAKKDISVMKIILDAILQFQIA